MNKRLKLQCWNCPKTFFETLDLAKQKTIITCPYCNVEAVVDLRLYGKNNEIVMRHLDLHTPNNENNKELDLPDILPTKKSE